MTARHCAWLALTLVILAIPPAIAYPAGKGDELLGKKAPEFVIPDIDGKTWSSEYLLKTRDAYVVSFWGLRCGACIQEIPVLNRLQEMYKERICVLGVNADAVESDALKEFMQKGGMTMNYTVIPDPEMKMIDMFRMVAAPYTLVIDSTGTVRYVHLDYKPGDEKELEQIVEKIIGENRGK